MGAIVAQVSVTLVVVLRALLRACTQGGRGQDNRRERRTGAPVKCRTRVQPEGKGRVQMPRELLCSVRAETEGARVGRGEEVRATGGRARQRRA